MTLETVNGTVVMHLPEAGPLIGAAQDALDVIGEAWAGGAEVVTEPADRLAPEFFDLRSGVAGTLLQKFVNYRMRLAILGDVSAHVAASEALGDFVRESNRGSHVWFLDHPRELAERLAP
ncbi:DUF4180 domain-containing protein [Georgenia yuyongxinii]|uniref:DUF4180 domain-containing protein n=1 Tax=Georgenia yuyongxinii TaxID=2589797 RepID=A0A552WPY2_9MICO|nr:DUF4180 domain-containing protein [Georgenia yuyongxinii]TRW44553.1 DUF4180 domain-containing protein [Georgenia yuyongxinii]